MKNILLSLLRWLILLLTISPLISLPAPALDKHPADWQQILIRQGQKQLAALHQQNEQNQRLGQPERNQYLLVLRADQILAQEYPNSEFIRQSSGTSTQEEYMLTQEGLKHYTEQLRTINRRSPYSHYLILVHYIPVAFLEALPDYQTIQDIIRGQQAPDLSQPQQQAAQQARQAAYHIIEALSEAMKQEPTAPAQALYCGVVNFMDAARFPRGFKYSVYYPRPQGIPRPQAYIRRLDAGLQSLAWERSDYQNIGLLIDHLALSTQSYPDLARRLAALEQETNPAQMRSLLRALGPLDGPALTLSQRLHALNVLAADLNTLLSESGEALILSLLADCPERDAAGLLLGIQRRNPYAPDSPNLLSSLLGGTANSLSFWGEDRFAALINALVKIYRLAAGPDDAPEARLGQIPEERIFYWGQWEQSREGTRSEHTSLLRLDWTGQQVRLGGSYHWKAAGKTLRDELLPLEEISLNPFETIGVVFWSQPQNSVFDQSVTGRLMAVPAIALYGYQANAWTRGQQAVLGDLLATKPGRLGSRRNPGARQSWRVWLAWAELGVNSADFLLNHGPTRGQIRALPGGGEFLYYWDMGALVANGTFLTPFAAKLAQGLVHSVERLGRQGAEVVGKEWEKVKTLADKLRLNYRISGIPVAMNLPLPEIEKLFDLNLLAKLDKKLLQKISDLGLSKDEIKALNQDLKSNDALIQAFNENGELVDAWRVLKDIEVL
ncbi:MAG: hypothetical protein HC880_04820, partial [Bacteroidia bacterium]|nr:hypothetical protein [Bacteroidia bacterium]